MAEKFVKVIKSKKKRYLDKELEKLANNPTYKDIMQKAESSLEHTLNPELDTEAPNPQNDDISIFTQAETIMESLENGEISLGSLDLYSKAKLLYYLERYNKRVGRVLDIMTRIPTSSIALQKPKTQYAMVNDYVYKRFEGIFNSEGFLSMIEKVVRHYWLFSFASVLIEDDYTFLKESDVLDDIDVNRSLRSIMRDIGGDGDMSVEQIRKIDKKYVDSPSSVLPDERKEFLKRVMSVHSPEYKGAFKFTVLPVFSTIDRFENNDVGYYIYNIPISENLVNTIESIRENLDYTEEKYSELLERVKAAGYSEAFLNASMNADDTSTTLGSAVNATGNRSVPVDSDPYNDIGMYVVSLQRQGLAQKDNSIFNRVFMDAIDLAVSQRRMREKINRGFKKDILITVSENVDEAKLAELQNALDKAAQSDEGTFILTNMDVNANDLDLNVNSNLDLQEIIDAGNQNISEGVGISESLITDSAEQYANAFLKTTILENEMTQFRVAFKAFIEKQIFEPIAVKMGFIIRDEWGDPEIVYPKITFSRLTLARGSDDLEAIGTLVENGSLPVSIMLESLGFDKDQVLTQLRDEQLTLLNPQLKESFSEKVGEKATEALIQNERLLKRLADSLDVDYNTLLKMMAQGDE